MKDTILFGNGINRLNESNQSWGELLKDIKGNRQFEDKKLPNTMIYERIILDRPNLHKELLVDEFSVKQRISDSMKKTASHPLYLELYNLKATNYLTTNYDYGFLSTIQENNANEIRIEDFSTEDVYSIRREKRIYQTVKTYKSFWQLHGEISRPASIMLGLDHYCGSVGKIDNYIKGSYEYRKNGEPIRESRLSTKLLDKAFTATSWVELFFNSNVSMLGFTLDYSEIDLWWILNKRARMLKNEELQPLIKNKVTFYCSSTTEEMRGLLKSMAVDVVIISPAKGYKNKYEAHYWGLLPVLKKKIK